MLKDRGIRAKIAIVDTPLLFISTVLNECHSHPKNPIIIEKKKHGSISWSLEYIPIIFLLKFHHSFCKIILAHDMSRKNEKNL